MTENLGKIEKPEASKFLEKKKIYLIPLLIRGHEPPPEYVEKFDVYWNQVMEQVANLEIKIGKVNRVYHESVALEGHEGLDLMEKISPESFKIAKEKCQNGANLEAAEDRDMVEESMDWERFLMIGFVSQKVARLVTDNYLQITSKRYEYIAQKLDKSLMEGEAALLFIREGHRIQFPKDIEVFSIAPPALDELHRWIRDQQLKQKEEEKEGQV